jgi:hypothetical protein
VGLEKVRMTVEKERLYSTHLYSFVTFSCFKEIIAVYTDDRMKPVNPLHGKNAELLTVEAGGA